MTIGNNQTACLTFDLRAKVALIVLQTCFSQKPIEVEFH